MTAPIEVCLTVDVEFSVAGALTYPDRFQPLGLENVTCPIGDREHGLGLLLDQLADHGLTSSFFCETMNSIYFGDEPMAGIVRRIQAAGHEVQLHLHPCWLHFRDPNWRQGSAVAPQPVNDTLVGRDPAEIARILAEAMAIWQRWGLDPPLALRTGGLQVDRSLYRVMADLGIPLASNIGLGVYCPEDPALHLCGGCHRIEGIVEIPVLSYYSHLPRWQREPRSVTLAGSSWSEIRWLLERAQREGISPVVILTHPFELVIRDRRHRILGPNRLVQQRLAQLCQFLDQRRETFTTIRLSEGWPRWSVQPTTRNPTWNMPWPRQLRRSIENRLNDRFG